MNESLTAINAAGELGVTRQSVYNLIRRGRLTVATYTTRDASGKIVRRIGIDPASIERYKRERDQRISAAEINQHTRESVNAANR